MNSASWSLAEPSLFPNNVVGQNGFVPTSGELVTGATAGLKIADFVSSFAFNSSNGLYTGAPVTNFSSTSYKSLSPQIQIVAPIPEPASMLMVALGAAVLGLRKKQKTIK